MADKKKMSVADILAAARKSDGSESADEPVTKPTPKKASPQKKAPAIEKSSSVAKPGSSDRPNVTDILALARAGKAGDQKPAEKSKPKPKPATKPKSAAAAGKAKSTQEPATVREPRESASILAAARKSPKSGPMSKAEAASQSKTSSSPAVKAKPKLVVPPMPTRPAYVTRAMEASAVGSAKKGKGGKGSKNKSGVDAQRRTFMGIGFWALGGVSLLWTLASVRFMFPNVLREPPSKFKVGSRDAFPAGQVQTKFKAQYGVWVISTQYQGEQQLVALKSVCTHLGCTPNWLEAEQKFKCPCHGSGFYKDGVNFEGPAPRPLERYAIQIADDGQVEIDKSRTFQEEMGEWSDPACFILV